MFERERFHVGEYFGKSHATKPTSHAHAADRIGTGRVLPVKGHSFRESSPKHYLALVGQRLDRHRVDQ